MSVPAGRAVAAIPRLDGGSAFARRAEECATEGSGGPPIVSGEDDS